MSQNEPCSDRESESQVVIREFYNDFIPPRYVARLVTRLVSSVPEKYLRGLESVVLTNQSGAPRRYRLGKVTSRKRRVPQNQVCGRYYPAHQGRSAWIELYVDKLARAISYHPLVPLARTACFGRVLFHEIGHHVDATVRPEFRDKENVADDWGKRLTRNYLLKRYRFVPRPVWKILGWSIKAIAEEL